MKPSAVSAERRFDAASPCRLWLALVALAVPLAGGTEGHAQYSASTPPARLSSNLGRHDSPGRRPLQSQTAARPLPSQIAGMPTVTETLEVVHRRSQLIIGRTNITRTAVADPSVVDVVQYSPNEISVIGLGVGTTTLTLWFESAAEPLIYLVKTVPDPNAAEQRAVDYRKLQHKLALLFPNSSVHLIPIGGRVVVKGQAYDAEEAARILQIVRGEVLREINARDVAQPATAAGNSSYYSVPSGISPAADARAAGPPLPAGPHSAPLDAAAGCIIDMLRVPGEHQVMLRVCIAELNRTKLRRLGVDFNALISDSQRLVWSAIGGVPAPLTGVFENGEINVLVNWLERTGTAKILSEPVLTTLSGHPASFLSGGMFAVPTVVGVHGVPGQHTMFRGFGTSLVVTPTVFDRDLIRMRIIPEFSQINPAHAVGEIPGLDARQVQTTVELREGQTIAIAGLISCQTKTEVDRIPCLSSIPGLGPKLFTTTRSRQEETELLILVTPELVRPMDADEVPPVPGHCLPGHCLPGPSGCDPSRDGAWADWPYPATDRFVPYGPGTGFGEPIGPGPYAPMLPQGAVPMNPPAGGPIVPPQPGRMMAPIPGSPPPAPAIAPEHSPPPGPDEDAGLRFPQSPPVSARRQQVLPADFNRRNGGPAEEPAQPKSRFFRWERWD